MDTKQCTKCKEYKTPDNFYRNNQTKDKLQSWCKACTKKGKANTEPDWTSYKWCRTCNQRRRADNFYRNRTAKDGLTATCKHCKEAKRQQRKEENDIDAERYAIVGTNFTVEPYERGTNERLDALLSPNEVVWIVNGNKGRRPISAATEEEATERYIEYATELNAA